MIKITIEHPTETKQYEVDGIYATVIQGSESSTLAATDYEKGKFDHIEVVGGLACTVDKTIHSIARNQDVEILLKAIFLSIFEDLHEDEINKKIKKTKKEIKKKMKKGEVWNGCKE